MLAGYALTPPGKHPQLRPLPVELPNVQRSIVIVSLRNRTLSPLAELFIKTARELAKPQAKGEMKCQVLADTVEKVSANWLWN